MSRTLINLFLLGICLHLMYLSITFVQEVVIKCPAESIPSVQITQPIHSLCVSLNSVIGALL